MTRFTTAAGAPLAIVALLLGACSSKTEPAKPSVAPSSTMPAAPASRVETVTTPPAPHGGLADCLHAHGVPESAGAAVVLGPPGGVDPATWQQAVQACSSFAPGPAES